MFHFLQKKMVNKIRNKGTINVLQGGGQRSMVKDHKMTIFFGTLPLEKGAKKKVLFTEPAVHLGGGGGLTEGPSGSLLILFFAKIQVFF